MSTSISNVYNGGTKYFQANSIEPGAVASGNNSIAVGPNALASGDAAIAQGYGATASATNAIAVGTNANAAATDSVAFGAGARVNVDAVNSVALGANSIADRANTISVGSADAPRQITNVAAGTADTDAVNVSQLRNMGAQANNYADNIGRKAYAGVAMAMALQAPQWVPGKTTYSASVGFYQSQAAFGISVRRTSDTGRYSWAAGVSGSKYGGVGGHVTFTGTLD